MLKERDHEFFYDTKKHEDKNMDKIRLIIIFDDIIIKKKY